MVALTSRVIPDSKPLVGWVNGNLYKPTAEVFGILPSPNDVHQESSMQEFDPNFDYNNQCHGFLASKQAQKPALPIHTNMEHKLLKTLMVEVSSFNITIRPSWNIAVKVWNRAAEIDLEISYKLVEQLMAYYNDQKTNLDIKLKLSLTLENQKVVHDFIRNLQCSLQITAPP